MPTVMGLDLSLTAPALSVWDVKTAGTTLRTDNRRGDKRFCDIRDWLEHYVRATRPVLAMVEAVPPYDHASSSLERVHGVTREVLARYDVPFAYVNVKALKSFAAGDGRADKVAVMAAVEAQTGAPPVDDNAADAWVLRRMGEAMWTDLDGFSDAQLQALSSVEWPLKPGDPNWPQPYGPITRQKTVVRKCRHKVMCLRNGDHWLHPIHMDVCDRPPLGRTR